MIENDFNVSFGQQLRNIRKKHTNLNQEDFFEKYLKSLSSSKMSVKSSYQNYMTKLENGTDPCPLAFLPVYANIAGISIDELLGEKNVSTERENDKLTYHSVIKMLNGLVQNGTITIAQFKKDNYYSRDASSVKGYISIYDPVLAYALEKCKKMRSLLDDNTIDKEIFESWEKGFFDKVDDRLLNMHNIDEFIRYADFLELMNLDPYDDTASYEKTFDPSTIIDAMHQAIDESEHPFIPELD